mgnify:CR=1 FL=1
MSDSAGLFARYRGLSLGVRILIWMVVGGVAGAFLGERAMGEEERGGAVVNAAIRGDEDLPRGWGDDQAPGSYRLRRRDDIGAEHRFAERWIRRSPVQLIVSHGSEPPGSNSIGPRVYQTHGQHIVNPARIGQMARK